MEGENITITLTKYPNESRGDFMDLVEQYYSKYRKTYLDNINNSDSHEYLLRPLVYHLFSNYDAAIISITQSEKIAQRLFSEHKDKSYLSTKYQIQTGEIVSLSDTFNLQDYFAEIVSKDMDQSSNTLLQCEYDFVIISNFSVNKGLKIALGLQLFKKLYSKIDETLHTKESHYLLTKSNSWFDLSMTIFGKDYMEIFDKILDLRALRLKDIWPTFLDDADECIYTQFYDREKVMNAHIFVESSSSFGVEYSKLLANKIKYDNSLSTIIEWKVKSGHEAEFAYLLKDFQLFKRKVDYLNGKMDFISYNKSESLDTNRQVFQALRSDDTSLSKVTKQIRTNVLFNYTRKLPTKKQYLKLTKDIEEILDFSTKLDQFTFGPEDIKKIDTELKRLKVSRHIREKIKKCYSITNAGLKDHVLFEFYIEFIPWMTRLKWTILDDLDKIDRLIDVEKILLQYIEVFDNAYRDRTFNTYLFEDIHDLSVQYNASLIQLISVYNSCLHLLTRDYFPNREKTTRLPRFLVNINLNNTMSNDNSVNFHIHDINAPELLLLSLHKELLNFYIKNTGYTGKLPFIRSASIEELSAKLSSPTMRSTSITTEIDKFNILNDVIRLLLTFNWDFELYAFWFWSFNLQNTQLYNKDGFIHEGNFRQEIIRFIAVKEISGYTKEYPCPVPELYFYWRRYYESLQATIKKHLTHEVIREIKREIFQDCGVFQPNLQFPSDLPLQVTSQSQNNLELPNDTTQRIILFNSLVDYSKNQFKGSLLDTYTAIKSSGLNLRQTLEFFAFYYLKKLREEQHSEIAILRRNLDTGQPMKSFIKYGAKRKSFYMLDPQGGSFLCDQENLKFYYRYKKDLIRILWDISLRWKHEYLEYLLKKHKK